MEIIAFLILCANVRAAINYALMRPTSTKPSKTSSYKNVVKILQVSFLKAKAEMSNMDLNVHVNCLYICKFVLFMECKSVMQVPVSGGKVSCKYKYRIVLFFIFACRELIFPPSGAFSPKFLCFSFQYYFSSAFSF